MSEDGGAKGFPEHAFWTFSLAVYGRAGVAPACLALQDRHGLDVNLLLFACWVAASGRGALDGADLAAARAAAEPWQAEIVAPLRRVRRRLKAMTGPGVVAARRSLQATEIDAEHVEQLMIAATCRRTADEGRPTEARAADAAEGLAHYLAAGGVAADTGDLDALSVLLGGAFPDLDPEALDVLLWARFRALE